ncbi:hypothetical protein KOR42_50050 [Thalassoglobus neptunius]|uniref:Uncharacterized protein n=1 Tax=Thalassoglobus neptunius TaxID=1938619 RepID=A0A5C5VPN1_9PLAN|nr:hypothetical protein KOR42_50050 [Thalassoglobus neptunius]
MGHACWVSGNDLFEAITPINRPGRNRVIGDLCARQVQRVETSLGNRSVSTDRQCWRHIADVNSYTVCDMGPILIGDTRSNQPLDRPIIKDVRGRCQMTGDRLNGPISPVDFPFGECVLAWVIADKGECVGPLFVDRNWTRNGVRDNVGDRHGNGIGREHAILIGDGGGDRVRCIAIGVDVIRKCRIANPRFDGPVTPVDVPL